MKNDLNNIDLIIKQKLTDSSFSVPENEWNTLSRHLSVKNFFRFNAGQINIFYIGAFAALMSISGIFYAQNIKLKLEKKKLERIIESNSLIKAETILDKGKPENISSATINQQKPSTEKKNIINNSVPEKIKVKEEEGEGEAITIDKKQPVIDNTEVIQSDSIGKQIKTKKVVKRKVYIKKNPVIIKDTIVKIGS